MEKGRANLSRLPEAPIAKVIKDILGLWEVDCGIAGTHILCFASVTMCATINLAMRALIFTGSLWAVHPEMTATRSESR